MPTTYNPLTDPHNLIIFTTAPAGLGHLRVTQALRDGLPKGLHNFTLGATDKTLNYLHRLGSINPFLRRVQYLVQYQPFFEQVFTNNYRDYLRTNSEDISYQLKTLLSSHHPRIRKAVIVATHFSLAHQIAAVKTKIAEETGVSLKLCVIVTDDTFQKIWAVDGADLLLVPSVKIKTKYSKYFTKHKLPKPKILVNPYPVSPNLAVKDGDFLKRRKMQLDNQNPAPTHVLVPVSGAAVQLEYLQTVIENLSSENTKPYKVTVVAKKAPFTQSFLNVVQFYPQVETKIGSTSDETVAAYEKAFEVDDIPSLEITKPSEQAFKALLTPSQRGGVIFLFSEPVGRQEVDNIKFLKRHLLLPNRIDQNYLNNLLVSHNPKVEEHFLRKVKKWRGLVLPANPPYGC